MSKEGSMYAKQGLEILAEAAHRCPQVQFVFCGNGAGRADFEARCRGLANVRFLDLQPMARLGELLTCADVHLLPQRADAADLVMPSKLTGMLASGRPVVATAHAGTEVRRLSKAAASWCRPKMPPPLPRPSRRWPMMPGGVRRWAGPAGIMPKSTSAGTRCWGASIRG